MQAAAPTSKCVMMSPLPMTGTLLARATSPSSPQSAGFLYLSQCRRLQSQTTTCVTNTLYQCSSSPAKHEGGLSWVLPPSPACSRLFCSAGPRVHLIYTSMRPWYAPSRFF